MFKSKVLRKILILLAFLSFSFVYSQTGGGFLNKTISDIGDSLSIDKFKFDINKLKRFTIENDTSYIDTSLTIKKFYKFNYIRKDDFELLKLNNVGQIYNQLTYNPSKNNLLSFGYNANNILLTNKSEVQFYEVAYPVTELLFKTVFSQGQLTNALFTTNINRKLNFSFEFKALRSLGKYQNSLSGSKHFRFTYNYNSEKFSSRTFYLSQKLEKKENGGLTETALENFESGDPLYNEKSKLNVKFDDAKNLFFKRDFYSENHFNLSGKNKFNLGFDFHYTTVNNSYSQAIINPDYYGPSTISNSINDSFKFRTSSVRFFLNSKSLLLDNIKFGLKRFNYEFFEINSTNSKIKNNSNLIFAELAHNTKLLNLSASIDKKMNGDRVGNKYLFSLKFKNINNLFVQLSSVETHPGIIYDYYKSSYDLVGWNTQNKLINNNSLKMIFSNSFLDLFELTLSSISNYFYLDTRKDIDYDYVPNLKVSSNEIKISKIKVNKDFSFGKFNLDNTLLVQKVDQDEEILNLPDLIARSSIYIEEKIFRNVLDIQTGFTAKYFSKFYSSEYNPLISTFHIQNETKIGGYPIIDFFLNAKIRQTRLFFIFEHINSSLTGNKYLSTPTNPYRDTSFRFGLNWNLFN